MPSSEGQHFLDLGTMSTLDRQLRCLMEYVDDLGQEASKFNSFQRQVAKQQQEKMKLLQKRVCLFVKLLHNIIYYRHLHLTFDKTTIDHFMVLLAPSFIFYNDFFHIRQKNNSNCLNVSKTF